MIELPPRDAAKGKENEVPIEFNEQACMLAEESLKRFGFVVVGYDSDKIQPIGTVTKFLWKIFEMPQPFCIAGYATPEEWTSQIELMREVVGQRPHAQAFSTNCVPMKLITE